VKSYVNANVLTWLEKQAEWFNEHAMSVIPEDYIDDPEILARIRTRSVENIIRGWQGSFMGGTLMPPGPTTET
jgi:hypothetical protein